MKRLALLPLMMFSLGSLPAWPRKSGFAWWIRGKRSSSAPLGRKASAFIMLDNLFNRRYQFVAGYPMPGINAIGGFNFRF